MYSIVEETKRNFWKHCYNYIGDKDFEDYMALKECISFFKENDYSFFKLALSVCDILHINFRGDFKDD